MNNIIVDDEIFDAEEYENKIVNIYLKFSRGDATIKEAVTTKEAVESKKKKKNLKLKIRLIKLKVNNNIKFLMFFQYRFIKRN